MFKQTRQRKAAVTGRVYIVYALIVLLSTKYPDIFIKLSRSPLKWKWTIPVSMGNNLLDKN